MIQRQLAVPDFFEDAESMRHALDMRFKDPYTDSIPWYYFCDPDKYTYLRTTPHRIFPQPLFDRFMQCLRQWCMDHLGLVPMNLPYVHLMVNGCRLQLHSDFHNGTWGYVYSLTRWDKRKFFGGETLLLRDGVPSYKKHHVHGDVLYELIPAEFNQLLVFDDRIVHATPTIEGSMDPLDGRIALVGHIRAASPTVTGSLHPSDARRVILEALPKLRDRTKNYKEVQGTISYRIEVRSSGTVESLTPLTNNLVTATLGYAPTDAVSAVRSVIQQVIAELKFPSTGGKSVVIASVLIPIPDLRSLAISVPHDSSRDEICRCAARYLRETGGLGLEGAWAGETFEVREPIAGTIRIDSHEIAASFDAPMWVPSQRETFQRALTEWARAVARSAKS